MKYWLKLIGTTEDPVDCYKKTYVALKPKRGFPRIEKEDKMVLYASGKYRVFAIADVTSPVERTDQHKRWPFEVKVKIDPNLDVERGVLIDKISVGKRDLRQSIQRQSYIELEKSEYDEAVRLLTQKI